MTQDRTLGQRIGAATNIWRILLDRRLKPLGLSQARWRVLLHVANAGKPLTQSELARRLCIGGPSLVSLLDRMEADGWIERRHHKTDRRRNLVHLSARAEATMPTLEAEADRLYRELIKGLEPADVETAGSVLDHIRMRGEAIESEPRDREMDVESDA